MGDWAVRLHRHLGAALEASLLALARALLRSRGSGPLEALAKLHKAKLLSPDAARAARRLGVLGLARVERDRDVYEAARAVEELGASARDWRVLYDKLPDRSNLLTVLAALGRCRALDARLDADLLASPPPAHHALLLELAIRRRRPAAIARGLERVAAAQREDEVELAVPCARALVDIGRLERAALLRELDQPLSPRLQLGLAALPKGRLPATLLEALERATREAPPELVDATLFAMRDARAYPVKDPRWVEAIRRVTPDIAFHQVRRLLREGTPIALLAPKVKELLASEDAELGGLVVGFLEETAAGKALLAAARALGSERPEPVARG